MSDVSAKNKAGKQLTPGGKRYFPRKALHWLRRRPAGVLPGSVKTQPKPLRLLALREARATLGVVERGGNNRGPEVDKIIEANGGVLGEAWCGDGVAMWYRKAGSKAVQRAWAATRFLGRLAGMVSMGIRAGLPGDIVVFNFPGGHPDSDHTGLLVHYANSNGGRTAPARATHVKTLDANARTPNGLQGVSYELRPISLVNRTVRVKR